MNKKLIIGVVALIFLLGGGYLLMNNKDDVGSTKNSSNILSESEKESGSTDQRQATSSTIDDACQVFDASEIGIAFNVTVNLEETQSKKITQSDNTTKQTCRWLQPEKEAGGIYKAYAFSLDVENELDGASARSAHEALNVNSFGQSFMVVEGIGDAASFKRNTSVDKSSTQLQWVKDSTVYRFTAVKLSGVVTANEDVKIKSLVEAKF